MNYQMAAVSIIMAVVLSLILNALAIKLGKARQTDKSIVPAWGGVAILISWWTIVGFTHLLTGRVFWSLVVSSSIILLLGIWDVWRPFGPIVQLFAQVGAAAVAVYGGDFVVSYITDPRGGLINLNNVQFFGLLIPASIITLVWIVTMMNVVNFLDGMDGLAGSVSMIAFIAIGLVSLLPQVNDPVTAIIAFCAAAVLFGFLFWNYPPAALYLGTVGSWFIGFLLAILAIKGVTKVATTAVVGAVPLLDAITVILGRIRRGRSPFRGDRTHLHHRLKRRGLSSRSILLIYMFASLALGGAAVMLQTYHKILVFSIFSVLFAFLIIVGSSRVRKNKKTATTAVN